MFIKTEQYNIIDSACGINLSFDKLNPRPIKLSNIASSSRSDGVSRLALSNFATEYRTTASSGSRILVRPATGAFVDPTLVLDNSYLGGFSISTINDSRTELTYNQNLANLDSSDAIGELYLENNIEPRDQYTISFTVESIVPSGASIIISPTDYTIAGNDTFTPATTVQLKSKFSSSAKALIKMTITPLLSSTPIKTEYRQIIVSDSSSKPCEIISTEPIKDEFVYLDIDNNWTYTHQGYLLAKFIPSNKNIIIKLPQKNTQLLPSRSNINKLKVTANPVSMKNKKVSIDQIRSAMVEAYDSITNTSIVANLGNKSYDIIIEDIFIKPEDLNNLVVAIVPPVTGSPVRFSEVAKSSTYNSDLFDIPSIGFVQNDSGHMGELQFNHKIYNNEPIEVIVDNNTLSGKIKPVYDGMISVI
jgi:hypothetical protein